MAGLRVTSAVRRSSAIRRVGYTIVWWKSMVIKEVSPLSADMFGLRSWLWESAPPAPLFHAIRKLGMRGDRIEHEGFGKFKAYYSFESRFCNPDSGHEKGGVEGLVGFSRRNYMVPVPEAASLEELNEKVLRQCVSYGNHKMAGRDRTVNELYEEEKAHLLSLPEAAFSNVQISGGRADQDAPGIVGKKSDFFSDL